MFIENQDSNLIEDYTDLLKTIGALSNLFSESHTPYLDYRVVENIFCKSFKAINLARFDCSADAKKDDIGIGIKTFLHKTKNQKIAEFNEFAKELRNKEPEEQVMLISKLRNERIEFTKRNYGISKMIYHLVTRDDSKFYVLETDMNTINMEKIKIIKATDSSLKFKDDKNEYSFNFSKSTLYKKFNLDNILVEMPVEIIEDPYEFLKYAMMKNTEIIKRTEENEVPYVIIPLFSISKGEKFVAEKSGLNQWNAGGRKRDINEVYIPIRADFYRENPNFLPTRDKAFNVRLPNGNVISMKVCQDNGKSLMSNPNKALGLWLLRDVLQLREGELLKYDRLKELGIDSVILYKHNDEEYSIDFVKEDNLEEKE